jgi:hypothetical protein
MRKPIGLTAPYREDDDDIQDYVKPCPHCEYHKNRAARWRAEAYKQAGKEVQLPPPIGLTAEEVSAIWQSMGTWSSTNIQAVYNAIWKAIKEKNNA